MKTYESIRNGEDTIARTLSSSSLTQFFISTLVLIIAIFGGLINFQLIALPMSEMVGGTSYIGPMKTSDIAALVIIMVEIAMGLFLMESLRITHLFPIIGSMDDKMRKRMVVITFSILAILATVEASLAYMRDLLAMDREALTQSLAGGTVVEAEFRWIPSIGPNDAGFHPAVRAGLRRDPAGIVHPFAAHRARHARPAVPHPRGSSSPRASSAAPRASSA